VREGLERLVSQRHRTASGGREPRYLPSEKKDKSRGTLFPIALISKGGAGIGRVARSHEPGGATHPATNKKQKKKTPKKPNTRKKNHPTKNTPNKHNQPTPPRKKNKKKANTTQKKPPQQGTKKKKKKKLGGVYSAHQNPVVPREGVYQVGEKGKGGRKGEKIKSGKTALYV